WVIEPDGNIRCLPGPADAPLRLATAAERHREIMSAGQLDGDALDAVLRELYDVLWHPVAGLLPADPGETVVIVPHGPAMQVPFPGLRGADGRYLIERHAIALLPGLALAAMLTERRAAGPARQGPPGRLLAFVAPQPLPVNPDTGE